MDSHWSFHLIKKGKKYYNKRFVKVYPKGALETHELKSWFQNILKMNIKKKFLSISQVKII